MDEVNSDTIPTNLRLLLVIEEIARAGVPVTPTEVNEILGLPKPTIHRLFHTLEEEGFIQRDMDGKSYSPGLRLRMLSTGILSSLRIRTARQAIMKKVGSVVGETINIALPDRDAMFYIDRLETEWPLRIQLPVGTRVPFYCTASGKLYLSSLKTSHLKHYINSTKLEARTPNTFVDPEKLLAEIAAIRKQGYSTDREEFMENMVALAVPIKDSDNRLFATLSFHAPTQRCNIEKALTFLDVMKQASNELYELISDPE